MVVGVHLALFWAQMPVCLCVSLCVSALGMDDSKNSMLQYIVRVIITITF